MSSLPLVAGLAAVFGALVLLASYLFPLYTPRRTRDLDKILDYYSRRGRRAAADPADEPTGWRSRVARLAEGVPTPVRYEERLQVALDRAGWPLRTRELLLLRAGTAMAGAFVGMVVLRMPAVGALFTIAGWVAPRAVLALRVSRRSRAFEDQLPDTLQLLSASLEAGHGFLQGMDTVVKEAGAPTADEFARALAEVRLGMPVQDALSAMSHRIGGQDFKWAVVAMNIQREVGGNLAALLKTVADTMRERQQINRTVKVLSAEGRLSAIVLTAMPFLIAAYMLVVNPTYLATLLNPIGLVMVGGASLLLAVGGLWMRKIVRIDV